MANNAYGKDEFMISPRYRVEPHGNDDISFAYNAYFDGEKPSRIIIAYRGTDSQRDIRTGSLSPRQIDRGLDVYDDLRSRYPNAEFVVTGHSLGGAIALSVSHCRVDVTTYVFDTSTLYRKCRNFEDGNDDRRFSIVERGEILKILRMPTKKSNQIYTSINCRRAFRPVDDHSIRQLAECLTQYAAVTNADARASLSANGLPFEYGESAE
ncbi:hypothetical protein [Sphingomonas sp. NFR15]|uniref:lipase family protein n=1 Tax=Sphingomonas sp. NFR15 TaxID=1566282 RepID=UPI0015A2DD27|nr:hypothetical protein [Sphingomonas sp. NFR15]